MRASHEIGTAPGNLHHPSTGEFIDNPAGLRKSLTARGALDFTPYPSGLFPASDLSPEMAKATGMGMAWFRDNAHVINALYQTGMENLAVPAGRAVLDALNDNRSLIDDVVNSLRDPKERVNRLPVRVNGETLENDQENRVQNDSVGYAVWITSHLITDKALPVTDKDIKTIAQTVRYLEAIEFWQDADEGHWEEDARIHTSSIGVVIAALRAAETMFKSVGFVHNIDIDGLIDKGKGELERMLDSGFTDRGGISVKGESLPEGIKPDRKVTEHFSNFDRGMRQQDAALLFLIEPLGVLEGDEARRVVEGVEKHLVGEMGIKRYEGDTYWGPRFTDIMTVEERTSAKGSVVDRNQKAEGIAYADVEAQWTLFDPILSVYWGKRYLLTGDDADLRQQLFYLDRSLSQLVSTPDGSLKLPETYYHEFVKNDEPESQGTFGWVPNPHMPLLWSQANLLLALKTFEASAGS